MAFNPFHAFRKYSKAMFAVLAIICMFTFVLSSGIGGKGDFFGQVGDMFGGDGSVPTVAVIDGDKVNVRELQEVQRNRRLANEYMAAAVGQAHSNIIRRAMDMKDVDPLTKQQVSNIVIDIITGFQNAERMGLTQAQAIQRHISSLEHPIERAKADKKMQAADDLAAVQKMLKHRLLRMSRMDNELYFGGSIRSGDGLVDFLVWKWIADKRGIHLTDDTVRGLIEQETLGELTAEDAKKIQDAVIGKRQISERILMDAFADEFRVWIAQAAVIGVSTARDNVPAYATPYELRQDYIDKRTAVRVTLMPVSVDDYLAKVTEEPSEKDLKALFEKYKNAEWHPLSETPGFKQPKRIKLAFAAGKPALESFKKAGLEQARQDNLATATMPFAIGLPPAGGVMATLGGVMTAIHKVPELPHAKLKEEYERYISRDKITPWHGEQFYGFRLHETSVVRPEIYAATVASAMGALGTGGPPLSPASTLYNVAAVQEVRDRIRIGIAGFAAIGLNPWAAAALPDAAITPPLSLETLRPQLTEEINQGLARSAFDREMRKFYEELSRRSKELADAKKSPAKKADAKTDNAKNSDAKDAKKDDQKPDPKDADPNKSLQDYIAEFTKTFGLSKGESTELRDRFTIVNDPGLKSLAEVYFRERKKDDPKGFDFAPQLFDNRSNARASGLFAPIWFDARDQWFSAGPFAFSPMDEPIYLVWKIEETEARVRTFDEVKKEVESAWKWNKARELAKAAADEIAKKFQNRVAEMKLKDLAAIEAELRDFAAQEKLSLIKLDPLPRITVQQSPMAMMGVQYEMGRVSKEAVPDASFDFVLKLTDMRKKPPGETIVLNDQPKSRYYVGVLLGADPGSDYDFRQAFGRVSPLASFSDDRLIADYELTQKFNFRRDIIKQLRTDARVKTFEEELKRFDESRGTADES